MAAVPPPEELIARIKSGDPTLWGPAGTPEVADRLGWIGLPETTPVDELQALAARLLDDGPSQVVVLGMGGSSLAPEVFGNVFGGDPALHVIDSTHPEALLGAGVDPARALFLVSSKSGTTLETMAAFLYFWGESGGRGERFVAITDSGTPLEALARERGFRAIVTAPADVGGRYSALSPFGLLPAALVGAEIAKMAEAARRLDWDDAVTLGMTWAEHALAGRDKLTFRTPPSIRAFPAWLEQLVAESLGKDGKGILPVAGEPPLDRYGSDRLFVDYRLAEENPPGGEVAGPVAARALAGRYDLAREMFAAEVATAVAGLRLGVNPFDQPDVELAKQRARQALEVEQRPVDLVEFFSPILADRLGELLASLLDGHYLAIQAFVPQDPSTEALLAELRFRIGNHAGAATTLGFGPRFLHSTGQFHKGGPDTGVFLQLVDRPPADLAVPEMGTTFGRIIAAQAQGDYLALRERGRSILRIDLGPDRAKGLEAVIEAVG
jgi:transaldolase/glucose-6-phosphate isomerase